MFTESTRTALRDWLVELARTDERMTAAAVVGSGAEDREDAWSDIDLALRLAPGEDVARVADAWTGRVAEHVEPVAWTDVWARGALYRVFVLPDTLQVDLSFWPDDAFAAHGPRFRLLFGDANDPVDSSTAGPGELLGLGWLYALHVRSSLARGKRWQAVYMLNAMREQVIALACVRHGLSSYEGRGVDGLPAAWIDALDTTWPATAQRAAMRDAFERLSVLLLQEARHVDAGLSERLQPVIAELVRTA